MVKYIRINFRVTSLYQVTWLRSDWERLLHTSCYTGLLVFMTSNSANKTAMKPSKTITWRWKQYSDANRDPLTHLDLGHTQFIYNRVRTFDGESRVRKSATVHSVVTTIRIWWHEIPSYNMLINKCRSKSGQSYTHLEYAHWIKN